MKSKIQGLLAILFFVYFIGVVISFNFFPNDSGNRIVDSIDQIQIFYAIAWPYYLFNFSSTGGEIVDPKKLLGEIPQLLYVKATVFDYAGREYQNSVSERIGLIKDLVSTLNSKQKQVLKKDLEVINKCIGLKIQEFWDYIFAYNNLDKLNLLATEPSELENILTEKIRKAWKHISKAIQDDYMEAGRRVFSASIENSGNDPGNFSKLKKAKVSHDKNEYDSILEPKRLEISNLGNKFIEELFK